MNVLRRLGLLLVVAMWWVTPVLGGTGNTIDIGDANTVAGATGVQIGIDAALATQNAVGLNTLVFEIRFDAGLCDDILNSTFAKAGRATVAGVNPSLSGTGCPGTGALQVSFSDPGGSATVPDGSGAIITWTFDLSSGAPSGSFPLSLVVMQSAFGPLDVPLTPSGGTLNIAGPTSTPTNTPTATPTVQPTNTATQTPTRTPTATPTDTFTVGPSPTPSNTPTQTTTFTPSNTPTQTPTASQTFTPTQTPTASNTPTHTNTFTPSQTPTQTPTATNTPIPTPVIQNGATSGSTTVAGRAANNATVEIRTQGGEVLGTGTATGSGSFIIGLSRPLVGGETIVAVDTTNGRTSAPVVVGAPPAPIPTLGSVGAIVLCLLMAGGLLWTLRRRTV